MKKRLKVFIAILFTFIMFCKSGLYAASVNISANTSVEMGNNVTINISVPGVSGKCTVTSSNPGVVSLSSGSIWIEKGTTSPIVGYTKGVGSATITVTPSTMADDVSGDDLTVASKSITINVKEKYVPPVQNNTSTNQNTNSNSNNTGGNKNTSTATTNNSTTQKSSNANLSKLQVNVEGLTPNFNKNKLSYTLAVGENVNDINVTAIAEDSKAKVAVSGNKELKAGDNTISVVVTAPNGNKKTYNILVTKASDPVKSDSYLANLIIEDCKLSPEFSSEVFEYDLGEVSLEKLNVYAYPKNEKAKVEITGHESLVEGENVIKIKIVSEDETTTKEYVLKVNRNPNAVNEVVETNALVEEENIEKTSKSEKVKNVLLENWLVVLLFIFVIVEFVEILYLYCKYHKVKVTVPWKNNDENEVEKESWFKKLNKNNKDFDLEDETKLEKDDAKKELNDVEEKNIDEKNDEIKEEVSEENVETEMSYEEIMSKINELETQIDEGIQEESKEQNDDVEHKTRNGRNGRLD